MNDRGKPLITTIIPTYRRPHLLRRAIKSVLNQTYPHFQVCVYDNASGDETAEVVAEFAKKDPRVKYHCHPENIGALKNFNYGMKRVDTPFFSFLSDDDILLPEFYQTALEGFDKHPEAMFSACASVYVDDKGRIHRIPLSNWKKEGLYLPPTGALAMLEDGQPAWTGILFRREVIEKLGSVDEKVGPPSDLDFTLCVAANFPIVVSLKSGAIFFCHPLSSCARANLHDILPGWLRMINKFIEDEQIELSTRIKIKYLLTRRLQEIVWTLGISMILRGHCEEIIKSVEILNNHFIVKRKTLFLKSFARLCNYFPFIRQSACFLNQIRKICKKVYKMKRYKQFQELYPKYADCLLLVTQKDNGCVSKRQR